MGKISLPTIMHDGYEWGALNYFGREHIIAGGVSIREERYTFLGGHRVRLYSIKANVHWRIPAGVVLDVTAVPLAASTEAAESLRRFSNPTP
jgi:hypothetical protein